ncbi:hypothetical protein ABZP36_026116 [Zizania latifolia]
MHAPRRFKRDFMERLLLSLQVAGLTSKSMGLRERRDAVRVSSDVAMASARGRGAPWARALVARHAAKRRNEALLRRIMGGGGYERAAAAAAGRKEVRSRKIVTRSHRLCSSRRKRRSLAMAAASGAMVARTMVKGRLRLLRRLVPGADALHGFSLLSETLDYVVCLKTQAAAARLQTCMRCVRGVNEKL